MKRTAPIDHAWRLFLSLMIFAVACVSVMLMYSAFFAAMGKQWGAMTTSTAVSAIAALGVYWLATHRDELTGLN